MYLYSIYILYIFYIRIYIFLEKEKVSNVSHTSILKDRKNEKVHNWC